MRLEARLFFSYETEREAKAVVEAVSPDNVKAPWGLNVETTRNDCRLLAFVCSKRKKMLLLMLSFLLRAVT